MLIARSPILLRKIDAQRAQLLKFILHTMFISYCTVLKYMCGAPLARRAIGETHMFFTIQI